MNPLRLNPLRALLCGCLIWTSAPAAEYESGEHPLLDLARALESTRDPPETRGYYAPDVRASVKVGAADME